jgi:hypothetical protein
MGQFCAIFNEISTLFSSDYDEPDRIAYENTRDMGGASRK